MSNHNDINSEDSTETDSDSSGGDSGSGGGSSNIGKAFERAAQTATERSEAEAETAKLEIVKLREELDEARRKASENWDLFLRARADLDNARRRSIIDVENAHKYGIEKFAKEIIAVVDSLDHGLATPASEGERGLREGMELTLKLLLDTLEKFGIKALNPINENFDPTLHEALSSQVNNDIEPNKVLVVIQKGFTLQDRLLRPARVIVSRGEG